MLTDAWSTVTAVTPGWMIAAGAAVFLAWFLVWPVFYYFSVSVGHERKYGTRHRQFQRPASGDPRLGVERRRKRR